jgi:hypothetical protein
MSTLPPSGLLNRLISSTSLGDILIVFTLSTRNTLRKFAVAALTGAKLNDTASMAAAASGTSTVFSLLCNISKTPFLYSGTPKCSSLVKRSHAASVEIPLLYKSCDRVDRLNNAASLASLSHSNRSLHPSHVAICASISQRFRPGSSRSR